MHAMDTLDEGIISILGRRERDNGSVHYPLQNNEHFPSELFIPRIFHLIFWRIQLLTDN